MAKELLVIGYSSNVGAEYGQCADATFTAYEFYNDEPVGIEGFESETAIRALGKEFAAGGGEVQKFFTRLAT